MKKIKLGLKIDSSHISLVFHKQKPDASGQMSLRLVDKPKHQDFEIFDNSTIDRIEKEVLTVEKESGGRVSGIYFCFPQDRIKKITGSSQRIIHPKHSAAISVSDIRKSIEQARLLNVDWSLSSLHSFPVEFKVDAKIFKNPPIGVHGRRLEVKVAFFACSQDVFLNVNKFFERLGRNYTKLILNPLAEASALSESGLGQGNFIIINFGRAAVEVSVFNNFTLNDVATFAKAGLFVDEEISRQLNIPASLCEEIKVSYGSLVQEDMEDSRTVTVKRVSSYREIKKETLNQMLASSYKKTLDQIKDHLESGDHLRKADFIVPLGGGARIKGFDAMIESILDLPVRRVESQVSDDGEEESRFLGAFGALRFDSSRCNVENSYKFPRTFLRRLRNLIEEYF